MRGRGEPSFLYASFSLSPPFERNAPRPPIYSPDVTRRIAVFLSLNNFHSLSLLQVVRVDFLLFSLSLVSSFSLPLCFGFSSSSSSSLDLIDNRYIVVIIVDLTRPGAFRNLE